MERNRSNKFGSAVRHLKSNQIDEKLELLSEIPTNNIGNLYSIEPEFNVQDPDVPGEVTREADFTQDDSASDTTGLFDDDGTILTIEPPITADSPDRSYILGPMSSMWYAWGNFTQIGYIRESDRRMVNLGRITGQLQNWDKVNGFTSYGQLTLEQAVWFCETPKYLNGYDNYRAFYPGPPSNTPDQFGRYYCTVVGTTKPLTVTPPLRRVPPVQGGPNAAGYPSWGNNNFSAQVARGEVNIPEIPRGTAEYNLASELAMIGLAYAAVKSLMGLVTAGGLGAVISRLKYVSKLRTGRGALNPFGQRAVRSGAAGRQRVDVFSGRPYQGKRGFGKTTYGTTNPKTAATYSNPGPLKGTPGTGSRVNPRGTVDRGTLPQRYIDKYGSRSVLGQKQVKMGQKAAKRTFGESLDNLQINDMANEFIETLFAQESDPYEKIDQLIKSLEKYSKSKKSVKESKEVLSENRKRILRDIKKPYVLPEVKQEKYKFKKLDKVRAKYGRTINSDLMKQAEVPSSFRKADDRLWGKYEKEKNAKNSQDKKNVVLDHLGGGDHFLEYVYENGKQKNQISYEMFGGKAPKKVVRKEQLKGDTLLFIADENGKKESILQSEINDKLDQEFNKELFEKYFEEQTTEKSLFREITKRVNNGSK